MARYTVEHNVGTQGISERAVESVTVEAVSEENAITLVAGSDAPRAPSDSHGGSWVDYWSAFESEQS